MRTSILLLGGILFLTGCSRPSLGKVTIDWSALSKDERYRNNIDILTEGPSGKRFKPGEVSFENRFRSGAAGELLRVANTEEEEAKGYSVQVKVLSYQGFSFESKLGNVSYAVTATPSGGGKPIEFTCGNQRTYSDNVKEGKENVWLLLGDGLNACGAELARKLKAL